MSAPLAGLRILDFSSLLPGPYATMMLADLGAEVLRIEAPARPDLTRTLPPFDVDGISAAQGVLGRSKRSLALNLKAPGAAGIVARLVGEQGYDIVVEQSRPGVMDRLGVGYEALRSHCPALIFGSLTGYGQSGPFRDRAGHDLNYLALSGMLGHYGRLGGEVPPPLPTQVADLGGGSLHLVIGLLAAVIRRAATGEGAQVDISMHDGALAWNSLAAAEVLVGDRSPAPESLHLNGGTYYDLYATRDDRRLAVGPLEPRFWARFCTAIGHEELIDAGRIWSPAAQRRIKPLIRAAIRARTLDEWVALFDTLDACVEPVLTTREALDHPQTRARGMVVHVPRPDGTTQPQIGSPIHLSDHQPVYAHPGVRTGAHSREILGELGYAPAEIEQLIARGVVADEQRGKEAE